MKKEAPDSKVAHFGHFGSVIKLKNRIRGVHTCGLQAPELGVVEPRVIPRQYGFRLQTAGRAITNNTPKSYLTKKKPTNGV